MKYYLIYTEDCSLSMRSFPTKKKALAFVKAFKEKHPENEKYSDSWVELMFYGSIKEEYEGMESWRLYVE
jgi:hypothetical protein